MIAVYKTMAYTVFFAKVAAMFNRLLIFALVFLASNQVFAVGFGQALLHSHLGEPLDVRLPLLLSGDEKVGQFSISLASVREYSNLEQAVPESYHAIRVDVQTTRGKPPEIYIHSASAIDETIIVLVLKVKRGRGNFYKKMQFFLDAIDIQPIKNTTWKNTPRSQVTFTPAKAKRIPANYSQGVLTDAQSDGGWSRRSSYGPVQYGDSLSEIAYRLRKDKRWSNRQIMLALFDANTNAFANHDINQLKKGRYLTVPNDAAVEQFVGSQRYQDLKPLLLSKKLKKHKNKKIIREKKNTTPQAISQPTFSGRVSLGLQENLAAPTINPEVLQRLDKFEPMYQQAMATSLRMDGIGGKVDTLAKEVSQLRDKIDALARGRSTVVQDDTSYGWIGFILLLLVNIILLAAYFYRKQMKMWQNKLMEAQQQFMHKHEDSKGHAQKDTNALPDPMMEAVQSDTGLDEYDSVVDTEPSVNQSVKTHDLDVISMDHIDLGEMEQHHKKPVDHAVLFEEMVHKKEWKLADKHYELMANKDKERPRIQALLVHKLHVSGDVIGRNITLLTLSRLYEYDQWHRFCSYFDEDVWHEMQDEKVISFTGKVVESEMDKVNNEAEQTIRGLEQEDAVLDLSDTGTFDMTIEDFNVDTKENQATDSLTDEIEFETEEDDSILNMDTVDDVEIEPIADIISGEIDSSSALELDFDFEASGEAIGNGNDDTVMVTPEMMGEIESEPQAAGNHQNQGLNLEEGDDVHYPSDKGDTVYVSSKKMKAFRKTLEEDNS